MLRSVPKDRPKRSNSAGLAIRQSHFFHLDKRSPRLARPCGRFERARYVALLEHRHGGVHRDSDNLQRSRQTAAASFAAAPEWLTFHSRGAPLSVETLVS